MLLLDGGGRIETLILVFSAAVNKSGGRVGRRRPRLAIGAPPR